MRCPKCKSEMEKITGSYQYRESGLDNITLEDWPMLACSSCHIRLPLMPDPHVVAEIITGALVRQRARLNGDSIVFIRKAMGQTATGLANILGVARGSVSRWENEKAEIEPFYDFKLRMEAIDQVLPVRERRAAREEIAQLFQRQYRPDLSVSDEKITVPPKVEMVACV